ncbi:hypothetical protein QCA50_007999 [Cerrena zonata]|uniref:CCHC-type domain-containing protein n=1 Tax=Cerrena zonata TaxID=2478898 RepID=A0AAW0G559_9APHY
MLPKIRFPAQCYPNIYLPNEICPYPLKPGTEPLISNKCHGCGQKGHHQDQCTNHILSEHEQKWQGIAAWITCNARNEQNRTQLGTPPTNVNIVMPYQYYVRIGVIPGVDVHDYLPEFDSQGNV